MSENLFSYFRPMDESDLNWVEATEKRSYDFPWSRKGFIGVLNAGMAYVLCDAKHQKIGYGCFLTVLDEVQLLNICVMPDVRKHGVASDAIRAFKEHFASSQYGVMQLEVRVSNPAKRLYLSLGFKEDGVRKGYYPLKDSTEREDAVLMSCVL